LSYQDTIKKDKDEAKQSIERINLVRLKNEVLLSMLAIEQRKNESNENRLEALKWAVITESDKLGISLKNRLQSNSDDDVTKKMPVCSQMDLSGSIFRFKKVLSNSTQNLFLLFSDQNDGKILPIMSRELFITKLMASFPGIDQTDLEVTYYFDKTN
jgi:hypothetical protein